MKASILCVWLALSVLAPLDATVVSTGVMRYPVNLGPEADPKRIPIGLIPCESNHGYGTLELIAAPYPSIPGGWKWEGGIELNGNLASAYGISVEPEDSSNAPSSPVVVRIRKQAKPEYSPYTKEQVLQATLRCLLDTVRATPKTPLKITVITEDSSDQALQRFSGEYLTRLIPGDHFEETALPGCWVEVGIDGVREVVFEAPEEAAERRKKTPIWFPFPIEGDADSGYLFVPVWPGSPFSEHSLHLLGRPWPLVQDQFNPAMGSPDGNLLTRSKRIYYFDAKYLEEKHTLFTSLHLSENDPVPAEVAMLCWAAVLSDQPTTTRPLEVTLRMGKELDPRFRKWVTEGGWEEIPIVNDTGLRTTFVWDPHQTKLTTGTIPDFGLEQQDGGGWSVVSRSPTE